MRNEKLKALLLSPALGGVGSGLASAGLSAYGNALAENQYEKSDPRLIFEAVMAGLGGGGAAYALARGANPLRKQLARAAYTRMPKEMQERIGQQIQKSPMSKELALAVASLPVTTAASGLAGGTLAPFIASNLNLMGVPDFSGRQQDYVDQDRAVKEAGLLT